MKSGVARARVMNKATIKVSVEVMSWLKEDFEHEGWDRLVFDQELKDGDNVKLTPGFYGG
jgi:hypothetical protein